jgi:hypothetical protein
MRASPYAQSPAEELPDPASRDLTARDNPLTARFCVRVGTSAQIWARTTWHIGGLLRLAEATAGTATEHFQYIAPCTKPRLARPHHTHSKFASWNLSAKLGEWWKTGHFTSALPVVAPASSNLGPSHSSQKEFDRSGSHSRRRPRCGRQSSPTPCGVLASHLAPCTVSRTIQQSHPRCS